jgi:hypothetical protein
MKRITSNLLLLLAAVLVMAASCEKNPSPGPTPPDPNNPGPGTPGATKKEQISKNWKVESMLINNSPAQGVDYSGYTFTFKTDNTYDINAGTYSGSGAWELNSTGQQILLSKGTSSERVAVILSLTDTKLDLEYTNAATGKTGEQKVVFKLKQ